MVNDSSLMTICNKLSYTLSIHFNKHPGILKHRILIKIKQQKLIQQRKPHKELNTQICSENLHQHNNTDRSHHCHR